MGHRLSLKWRVIGVVIGLVIALGVPAAILLTPKPLFLRIERQNFPGGEVQVGHDAPIPIPPGDGVQRFLRRATEGGVSVRCINGEEDVRGYVTHSLPQWVEVEIDGCQISHFDSGTLP